MAGGWFEVVWVEFQTGKNRPRLGDSERDYRIVYVGCIGNLCITITVMLPLRGGRHAPGILCFQLVSKQKSRAGLGCRTWYYEYT